VEIPFHTYLTITPDKLLHKAFEELKYPPPQLAYYKKDTEPQQIELPTKENPLVYNAFGILDNKESMVLTHDDLYYYFKSIFKQGKSMPTALKTKLNNVEHIVFLGIPFHKWYMHLLLREFGEHRNEEIVRYAAADYEIPIDLRNFCDLQFKIHFIEDNITEFVDALYHKFEEEEILRVRPKLTDNTKNEVIKVFVGRNRLKRALKRLEDYAKGTKFQNEVIEIKAKFSRYKEKERKNTLTPTDLAVMHAQIVTEIVNLTDLIKG